MSLSVVPNENVTFALVHEDPGFLVIEKRAGLVTQPGKGHDDDTLLNGLFARWGTQLQQLGAARDYGLLHRLDRETSGLLVVGLQRDAYDNLRGQFETREVKKFYWAITLKAPNLPASVIDKPLAETLPKKLGEKKLAKVSGSGKPAQTAYRILQQTPKGCLIECRPLTGRLHQVRVHLETIGCPIVGDGLYAPRPIASLAPRLALHAHRLVLTHPTSGEPIDVRTKFPKDLRSTLTKMGLSRPDLEQA
jgi:23S rRNA pseudouridine1911/1915/1917 synthase